MTIKMENNKHCVYDGDTKKSCHDTHDEAMAAMKSLVKDAMGKMVEAFGGVKLTREAMKDLCPKCFEVMTERNITAVSIAELAESDHFLEAGFSQGMCDAMGGDEGFFTRCAEKMAGKVDDEKAFCAALHKHCVGKYPSEQSVRTTIVFDTVLLESAPTGKEFEVVLIEAGFSKNVLPSNNLPIQYSKEFLSKPDTLKMFEGVPLYAYEFKGTQDMLFEHLPDAVRARIPDGAVLNKIGIAENIRFGEFIKPDGSKGEGVIGRAKIFSSKFSDFLKNAWDAGKKDVIGLSIDAVAKMREMVNSAGARINDVLEFAELSEMTVVDKPGAGGILLRMTASARQIRVKRITETAMYEKLLALLRQHAPHLVEAITDEMPDDDRNKKLQEVFDSEAVQTLFASLAQKKADDGGQKQGKTEDKQVPPAVTMADLEKAIAAADKSSTEKIEQIIERLINKRNTEARSLLDFREMLQTKVKESGLPKEEQDDIVSEHFESRLTEEQINKLIKRKQDKWAKLKESGLNVTGQEEKLTVNKDQDDKWGDAMTGMLTGKKVGNVDPFTSIHESFSEITGITGNQRKIGLKVYNDIAHAVSPEPLVVNQSEWRSRLRESRVSLARVMEAALATTTWAEVFGDSIRRAMIMFYQEADWSTWRMVVSEISNASDFRTMRRVRIGGLADLADVAELGTYQEISIPADEEETFAVGKKGNLFSYSMESAVNDDLGALRRIPLSIGRSAARGIYKSVFDVFRTNPTMGDGVALFHATHANLGSSALSDPNLRTAIATMRDQTELSSGEVLGNVAPKFIVYPNELEPTAWELARSSVSNNIATPTRNETIQNWFLQFSLNPLPPIGYWTDANDWILVADPSIIPTIEISFLNGRQEPEILIQDQQNLGSVFTADKITMKGRIIYGVKALDPRGLFKAVVS